MQQRNSQRKRKKERVWEIGGDIPSMFIQHRKQSCRASANVNDDTYIKKDDEILADVWSNIKI